jgi:tetratricopeptide (TPR) repeat protein
VRGWSLARLGRTTEAHDAYGTALAGCKTYQQIDRVNEHLQWGLGPDGARTLLENARDTDNGVLISLALADVDIRTGQNEPAITRLKDIESKMKEYSPNRLPMERALALALHQTKKKKMEAHAIYQKILRRAPRDVDALCGMAWILSEVPGRADQAFKYADAAVKADPDSARARATMGWVRFRQGKLKESILTLRHCLELERSSTNCLYLARVLMGNSDEASADEALKLLNESAELAALAGEERIEAYARKLVEKLKAPAAAEPAAADN